MAPFLHKKLLICAGGVVGVLIVALVTLPFLIDMNAYKPGIIAEAKQATGRDLAIEGPIQLSLLPLPVVRLNGVRFASPPDAKDPSMVEAKSIAVRLSLLALITGSIEATEATLVAPRINLEVDAAGQANWAFAPSAGGAGALPVRDVRVEDGTFTFSDAQTGLSVVATKVNFIASAGSMSGPFALAGSASIDGSPLKFDLALGARGPAGHDVDISLEAAGGRLGYIGTLSDLAPDARLSGKASASADNLVLFVETLAVMAGQPRPSVPPLLAGRFRFDGPVALSRAAVTAKDFTLVLGDEKLSGSLTATVEPGLTIDARLAATRFDLDRWLKAVVLPAEVTNEKAPAPPVPAGPTATSTTRSTARSTAAPAPPPPTGNWLAALTARLGLEVGELIYNQQPVRNIAIEIEARNGVIAVPKFGSTLPGGLVVRAASTMSDTSARPRVTGDFSLEGPKLRETLAWLRVDTSSIPADKLTRVSIHGRMGSRAGNVQVNDAAFELDDLKGQAGITVAFTVPMSVELQLGLDTVDLDSFLLPPGQSAARTSPTDSVVPLLALLGPSLGLKLKVARINYRGEAVSGVDLDIARQAGTLKLNDFKVTSLAGARVEVRGAVADYWTPHPRASIAFKFDTPDIDRVLKLAAAPPTGFGAVSASGEAAGTWESLAIRQGAVSALGSTVRASGALALLGVTQGKVTSISYKGSVIVDDQPMNVSISAKVDGRPDITADVKADAFDFDKLFAGRHAPRPATHGRPAAAPEDIDTASLRGFDGKFRLTTGALGGTAMQLGNTDVAAELKDGRLTIVNLKGGLYGGSLNLAGVVDATQPALAFDLKGDAKGLRIGDMMRGTSGSNEVGSLIKVTLDGILNADDIELRGTGSTVGQLKSSLAGRARLSGHINPRADRFLQVIGAAATGVTGGAIDFTLGNLASLFGNKGGIGIGNLLNAISLVLNRFVNHDNPLSGEIDIAGGVLSDKHLQLQGSGATAAISTRTRLENATTDTTINFMLSESPSTPYLIMTARGPLAGPTFAATRGGAQDPPGMVNILSNIEKVPSMLPSIPVPSFHIPNPFGR